METLTCPICFHEFNSTHQIPLVLHCGHTFCSSCIKSSERRMGALQCSLCRALDYREFSIMKKNMIVFQNLSAGNQQPTVPCPVHPGLESIFFCMAENLPFCLKCVTLHKFHDFFNIDDEVITQGTDKDLAIKIETAESNLEKSEKERNICFELFEEIQKKKNLEEERINQEFDKIVESVNYKRKQFVSDLNGKFNSVTRKIQKVIEECDNVIGNKQRVIQQLLDTKKRIGKVASSERLKLYQQLCSVDLAPETRIELIDSMKNEVGNVDFKVNVDVNEVISVMLKLPGLSSSDNLSPISPGPVFEEALKIEPTVVMLKSQSNSKEQVELVRNLVEDGIDMSTKIISVLESTDRKLFMPLESKPYEDRPQRIGYSTTISAPHMHAHTLKWLEKYLKPGLKVLDVGCGSGYLTLCLAKMIGTGCVYGLDHIEELINQAIENINNSNPELVNGNGISIRMIHGDGRYGLPDFAPFDVIHIGASTPEIPRNLLEQLSIGGILMAPVGPISSGQRITIVEKDTNGNLHYSSHLSVCYAPLTDREKQCPT